MPALTRRRSTDVPEECLHIYCGDVHAGLSCFIERHQGIQLVGHSGDQNGFISHLYINRASRSGYIVSFNTDVSSKRDPRRSTRTVDGELRDAVIREMWSGGGR